MRLGITFGFYVFKDIGPEFIDLFSSSPFAGILVMVRIVYYFSHFVLTRGMEFSLASPSVLLFFTCGNFSDGRTDLLFYYLRSSNEHLQDQNR